LTEGTAAAHRDTLRLEDLVDGPHSGRLRPDPSSRRTTDEEGTAEDRRPVGGDAAALVGDGLGIRHVAVGDRDHGRRAVHPPNREAVAPLDGDAPVTREIEHATVVLSEL
jgi:hypothetical protein